MKSRSSQGTWHIASLGGGLGLRVFFVNAFFRPPKESRTSVSDEGLGFRIQG